MAEILDPSKDFSSPYHVSSQQHMICSSVHNKRDNFVSTSGLLWRFDEANHVKKFKTMWSYMECMKISWRLEELGLT